MRPCLDVETGIRPDGAWVQGWLDAAGAGLYGLASVHHGRRAAFHVVARYPGGDPAASWDSVAGPRPDAPCGWQWQGSHPEFGRQVDRGSYDDWFLTGGDPLADPTAQQQLAQLWDQLTQQTFNEVDPLNQPITTPWQVAYIRSELRQLRQDLAPLLAAFKAGQLGGVAPPSELPKVADAFDAAAQQLRG